jgi:hypothetical protein
MFPIGSPGLHSRVLAPGYRLVRSSSWCGAAACPYRDRSVDVFVRKLRRKLCQAAPGWTYIHTHFGIGYRFVPERTEAEAGSSAGAASEPDPSSSPGDGADPLARATAAPAAG